MALASANEERSPASSSPSTSYAAKAGEPWSAFIE